MSKEKELLKLLEQIQPMSRAVGGVLNRVPREWGRVVIKTVVGFGFREDPDEGKEGPYAGNGEDSLVTSDTNGCCDIITVILWANGERFPDPLVCKAGDGKCLIRNTWTLAPKMDVEIGHLKSGRIVDLLECKEVL